MGRPKKIKSSETIAPKEIIEIDEETIIAKGLLNVRDGIVNGDWQMVCNGYNSISGEKLEPPNVKVETKKLSKLEAIRQKMAEATPTTESSVHDKDIIQDLDLDEEDVIDQNDITESKIPINQKAPGAKVIGKKQMTVITGPFDPDEAKKNRIAAKRSFNPPRPPSSQIKRESKPGSIRFIDKQQEN